MSNTILHIPAMPEAETVSPDFTAKANGLNLPIRYIRVTAIPFNTWWPGHQRPKDQTEFASYTNFSLDGKAEIEVVCHTKKIESVEIKPTAFGIVPHIDGQKISFTVDKPCHFTVEVNGWHNCLHVFVSSPENYGVDINDKDVIYFGPGVHKAGLIEVKSGQTVYVDESALVYGSVFAKDAENIKVLGRGVIDSSPYKRIQEYTDSDAEGEEILNELKKRNVSRGIGNVLMIDCKNVLIDGLVFRDPPEWSYNIYHCENVRINDVKLIGLWRYNADGIDIYLGKNFEITNSFIRSFDDSIIARGACGPSDEDIFENMLTQNCVLWCEWGRAIEIWTSQRTSHMKDIFFKDIYRVTVAHGALDIKIYRSGPTYIDNVVCENIYVDTDRHADRPIYQKQENQIYEKRYDDDYMPILFFIGNAYEFDKPLNPLGLPADVNYTNVTFRNIHVTGHRMPQSILKTIPGHMRIENVSFDGIYLGDKRFESFDDMNIFIGSDAKNVTLS